MTTRKPLPEPPAWAECCLVVLAFLLLILGACGVMVAADVVLAHWAGLL